MRCIASYSRGRGLAIGHPVSVQFVLLRLAGLAGSHICEAFAELLRAGLPSPIIQKAKEESISLDVAYRDAPVNGRRISFAGYKGCTGTSILESSHI